MVAELGADIIKNTSYFISHKAASVTYTADVASSFIYFVVAGFLIFFIFNTKIRFLGIPVLLLGYALIVQKNEMPDIVVNESGSLVTLKTEDGGYKYLGINRDSFALYQLSSKLGTGKPEFIKSSSECSRKKCVYKNVAIGNFWQNSECGKYEYMINTGKFELNCDKAVVIDRDRLKELGTHLLYLDKKKVVSASDSGSKRIWNRR